ncbi:hypothetical protein [uncultured Bacteroides sp.]|uniref:hypothetical protein n=1 Tax=uncultured Bacteroides sp. TaxID=162156 RepID=UPI00261E578F|nr:hypothetical protein [uncultured Bacteroides sp.]
MRSIKSVCLLLLASVLIPVGAKEPKDKNKYGVYIAGVSASFKDSLVFFTDIQYVDSAAINKKGLLESRAQYSMQLNDFLEQQENLKHRTSMVFYNRKKKNLEKEVNKIRQKYQKGGKLVLKDVNSNFKFKKAEVY